MKLCDTKYFAKTSGVFRRLALAVLALALVLVLPVAGGHWVGLPAAVWLEFPPRQVVVQHTPYVWWVWLGLALAILAAVLPVVWRVVRSTAHDADRRVRWPRPTCLAGGSSGRAGPPDPPVYSQNMNGYLAREEKMPGGRKPWPVWGWIGMALMLVAWVIAWSRFPVLAPIQHHTYVLVWTGYIVTIMALTQRRAGACLLTRRPAVLAGLAACSAVFWWGFEFLNRGVQNWFYQNLAGFAPFEYALMATLSFTTVLPAVLGTHDWLVTMPRLTAGLENWFCIRFARPRLVGTAFALAGAVGLFFLPVFPNALFPLLWLAPLALLCGLLAAAGEVTLFDDLGRGDWRTLVRLSLAALICGGFWEMWNMYSLARWVYDVPYVGRFQIFEMPLLGFAGYGPFGWECAAVAMVFGLWQPPQSHLLFSKCH
ncbi:MAG: hypothetical protein ACOYOU_09655 [Kiritimatiellia bacterium]